MLRAFRFAIPILLAGGAAAAATIDPADFDRIYTEGNRTQTVDGADISGNAAVPGNGDIGRLELDPLPGNTSVLLAGRVAGSATDRYIIERSTNRYRIDVINYAKVPNEAFSPPFEAMFTLYVGPNIVERVNLRGETADEILSYSFADLDVANRRVRLDVTSVEGRSDYDISVAAVPVPAAGLLLIGGLGALGAVRRRRAA